MTASRISYQVEPAQGGHQYLITMRFSHRGQLHLSLPIWIPGSYTRRDFSKHLSMLTLTDENDQLIDLKMKNPSKWVANLPEQLQDYKLSYKVYARDISVRGCYLDHERGIFNPCAACLYIDDKLNSAHELVFSLQYRHKEWAISGADIEVNGTYLFDDYHHMIDTPFILGRHLIVEQFELGHISHQIVISGHSRAFDMARLTQDIAQICQQAVSLFDGNMPKAVTTYRFLLHLTDNVFGGLEHRSSTMLMAPRKGLPVNEMTGEMSEYVRLLGLFSHEYFHTWNVKDLIPADYQPYHLDQEHPSEMLWFFEGFTAYFDNWLLMRSGVINQQTYLDLLAQDISSYWQRRGRLRQTLAQSSFEAWTKLYNGGEDAVNCSTNYYIHGPLMAMCLDAFLRTHGQESLSLAKVMARLWQQFKLDGLGMNETLFRQQVAQWLLPEQVSAFNDFLTKLLHSCEPLPLDWACRQLGLKLVSASQKIEAAKTYGAGKPVWSTSEPGFRWSRKGQGFKVMQLDSASPAAESGLAVDDEIIAVNHFVATHSLLERALLLGLVGEEVTLHVFRDTYLYHFSFKLQPAIKNTASLTIDDKAALMNSELRRQWLN